MKNRVSYIGPFLSFTFFHLLNISVQMERNIFQCLKKMGMCTDNIKIVLGFLKYLEKNCYFQTLCIYCQKDVFEDDHFSSRKHFKSYYCHKVNCYQKICRECLKKFPILFNYCPRHMNGSHDLQVFERKACVPGRN